MSNGPGFHNRQTVLAATVCNLLYDLGPSTYDEIAPTIEYWIEYGITERFTTIEDLVERVSPVAWNDRGSHSHISRFLKEFREAPRRSEQMRFFVDELCLYILRWFSVASADDFRVDRYTGLVSKSGGVGFIRAASFVGHLIESGLLGREPVRRHLSKSLTTHYCNEDNGGDVLKRAVRANAIYKLFTVSGNTLLRGLLEPENVQVCFERLETRISLGEIVGLDSWSAARLNELLEIHTTWLQQQEEEQRNATATEVSTTEVETPVAFVPQDLPAAQPPETFADVHVSARSSPTLSISTVSDLTPTELGDDVGEASGERINTRHDTFYFEDGNVEVECGDTVFRVHSTIISFASTKLRDIFSQLPHIYPHILGGCPRIIFNDSAEDVATLLKMIYTPGFPARNKVPEFTVFASLLRMTTKYGFPDIREALIEDLKSAYPTKWEDFETARILGEDVFGLPRPHPNAVLNLFLEQNIKFASPFAAYRAGLGVPSSLASDKPGAILPRPTLVSIIHSMGEIRRMATVAAHGIVYVGDLSACIEGVSCTLNALYRTNQPEQRMEALNKIYNAMVERIEGDMLTPPSLRNLLCEGCTGRLETIHGNWRKRFFWARLPRLLGWTGWEGA